MALSVCYAHPHSTPKESFAQRLIFARSSMVMAEQLFKFFVVFFVVVEPISLIPLFAGLTEGASPSYQRSMAFKSSAIALGICFVFAIAGAKFLDVMGIALSSFRIAGGTLLFLISLGVFGSEHFTLTASIASLVPRWMPAHVLWVYLVGLAFLCAAIAIALLIQARLAAALVGMTMCVFVLVMDLPAVAANPHNRFFWALALRQLAFSGGAWVPESLRGALGFWSASTIG